MRKPALLMAMVLAFNPAVAGADNGTDKDSYLQRADREIRVWSGKVERLERRAERAGANTRVELDRHVKLIREKLDVARNKLSEMQGASESGWKGFRRGSDEALQDVKLAYHNATAFLKTNKNKEAQ